MPWGWGMGVDEGVEWLFGGVLSRLVRCAGAVIEEWL